MPDDQLLVRSRDDPEAFGLFYRRHAGAVLLYLRRRTGDIEVAADLTADVFAAAWISRADYRPEQAPPRAWLFGIANNRLSNERRKRHRAAVARRRMGIPRLEFDDDALIAAERVVGAARQRGIAALVDDLPADQRAAVLARVIDERAYADIATELGISEATIRKRVSRGLAKLAINLRRQET